MRVFSWLLHNIVGWKPWKRSGSRRREVLARAALLCSILLACEAVYSHRSDYGVVHWAVAAGFVLASSAFFMHQILVVPLATTQRFQIDARRLVRDALISTAFVVMSFSLAYRSGGITGPDIPNALDHVYFSAVTFSTLGYGDFRPLNTGTRLVASMQAIIGNLHLAAIIAGIFLRVSRRTPDKLT